MLSDCAVRNGPEDFRIEARKAGQLLSIHLVALTIAVRDRPQLAHVATMTSWPNSFSCSLIHIECVPASMAIRTRVRRLGVQRIDDPHHPRGTWSAAQGTLRQTLAHSVRALGLDRQ